MKQRTMTIGQAADYLHVTTQTVRAYANDGKLECYRTPSGHRRFTKEQLDAFLGVQTTTKRYAYYARSSKGSAVAITNQFNLMQKAHGTPIKKFKDGSSGLNEDRPGLWRAYQSAVAGEYDVLVVVTKDRLTRFGYKYLTELFNNHNVTIQILQETPDKNPHEELMSDFMSLIASFSGKFYRLRSTANQRQLLAQATEALEDKP